MVFTMNTTVFAEEVAVDSVDEAVEATVDAADAADEATVDATDESVVAADDDVKEVQGIKYTEKAGEDPKVVTTIKYDTNGEKKNAVNNVATITNTTDPVSWNNAYATDLIATVLYGDEGQDDWLNNNAKVTVSKNDPDGIDYGILKADIPTLRTSNADEYYKVIPVVNGSQYLFVAYSLNEADSDDDQVYSQDRVYVAGYDDAVATIADHTWPDSIPVTEWDGRTIDFNKSGDYKFTTSKKEALDVAIALVNYSNGTVTEVNGVNVGSVKVDKKTQKAASVEIEETAASKTYTGSKWNADKGEWETASLTEYIAEHKTMGDLPFFTIKANVKGTDAKSYKKAVAEALKDQKFYFGITQRPVSVASRENIVNTTYAALILGKTEDASYTVSADDLKKISANDFEKAAETIEGNLTDHAAYFNADTDSIVVSDLEVTNFNESKGTATITLKGAVGDYDKGYSYSSLKTLSGKGKTVDYTFEDGSLANTSVKVLNFKDGGNFVYAPLGLSFSTEEKGTRVWTGDLAQVGFKWAFRKSPVDKSKDFRYGIYRDTNEGFVYSVEDAATDSVEEAF